MSHIFISYSSKDRPKTRKLAAIFEKNGWKVWWDKNITPGKAFDRAIGKALDDANCIVVLWSPNSVESNWVLEEAYEGLQREILIPALIAPTRLPFGYRRMQYVDLSKWKGTATAAPLKKLMVAIEKLIGPPKVAKTAKPKAVPAKIKRARTFSGALDGKRIVFTGALSESRNLQAVKVKTVGAHFGNSVSSKTDYLVVGKKPGDVKIEAAKKHGVKKITEKTWLKMLNEAYRRTLENKQIVFTGKLNLPRKELEKMVKKIGAKPTQAISGKTDFLIVGDKPGKTKLNAAEKYSVKIIGEDLWQEIVESM